MNEDSAIFIKHHHHPLISATWLSYHIPILFYQLNRLQLRVRCSQEGGKNWLSCIPPCHLCHASFWLHTLSPYATVLKFSGAVVVDVASNYHAAAKPVFFPGKEDERDLCNYFLPTFFKYFAWEKGFVSSLLAHCLLYLFKLYNNLIERYGFIHLKWHYCY